MIKILLTISLFTTIYSEKLVNEETGFIVVEFINGKAEFHDPFLEREMSQVGIYIPPTKTHRFEEREIVYLHDDLFKKAFTDVYYPLCIANSMYQWQD